MIEDGFLVKLFGSQTNGLNVILVEIDFPRQLHQGDVVAMILSFVVSVRDHQINPGRVRERKKEKEYSSYLDLHVVFADGKKMFCARKVRKPRARFTQILQICNIAARDRPNTLSITVHQNLKTIAKLLPPCVIYMHFLNFPTMCMVPTFTTHNNF